ncbi:Thymus-specific serine protease [Pseudolycoriella hygida]|uniref:Thymus-specific serine protease n=1 Tax=Pseudolycoriella hygida TaxID=35572 RepID=A0A9Q0MKA6_9DIPT|nr:Thymus-specific serine protease [Pseudolycoriella hygida]
MRTFLTLCGVLALIGASYAFKSQKYQKPTDHVTSDWIYNGTFRTRVDHFRAQDGRFVDFVYHANLNFTGDEGPVYIYLKDAGDYTTRWIESGLMVDIARQNNGSLFTFDYRFFGTNRPTDNATFENLQFLTTEQILADLAQFVSYVKLFHDVYGGNTIVYGAGYGGTLATWARKKFPHLIDAAWSSSGIYELTVASLSVYDSLSYSIYRTRGADCRNLIQEAFEEAERLIIADDADELQELFNLCNPINTTSPNDVSSFFQNYFDLLVLYIQQQHADGVHDMCDDLEESTLPPLEAFAEFVRFALVGEECFDATYDNIIAERSNTSWNQPGTLSGSKQKSHYLKILKDVKNILGRQWHYIQCTQAGLFQVTDQWTWLPNHAELGYQAQVCINVLGPNYVFDFIRAALETLRNQYGSLYLRSSRTIFTYGEIDPKMYNGITYTDDPESVAISIPGHGRASDMSSIQATDSAELQAVKERIIELVGNFSVPFRP